MAEKKEISKGLRIYIIPKTQRATLLVFLINLPTYFLV